VIAAHLGRLVELKEQEVDMRRAELGLAVRPQREDPASGEVPVWHENDIYVRFEEFGFATPDPPEEAMDDEA